MDESEDMSLQQQDAINAALEIAAAAAAAVQQQPDEDDNGVRIEDGGQSEIREEEQVEYINEDQPIQSELDVDNLTNFEQNEADASEQIEETAYREGESYETNGQIDDLQAVTGIESEQEYSHPSSQIHENIPANQFDQSDADQSGFNELISHSQPALHHSAQSNRALSHHSKRRKINTCLPCKRRKVKCDREKPYCGQCKKSQIPQHECTWSAAVEQPTASTTNGSTGVFPPPSDVIPTNGTNSNWNGIGQTPQAAESVGLLLERIAALEGLLMTQGKADKDASSLTGDARGIAANALAMIAQQSSNAILPLTKTTYKKMFSDLPSIRSLKIRDSVRLLPDSKAVLGAIRSLDSVQDHGIFLGLFKTLVESQFQTLQFPVIDLTLVALLFYVLAVSVDLMSIENAISLELVENEEGIMDLIEIWTRAADNILDEAEFESKPNLNILSTLLLKRQILASRGNVNAASVTLGMCIRLSRAMGLDKVGTQREDVAMWESSSKTQTDNLPSVVHLDQFMRPILLEGSQLDQQIISKTSWLSLRCATVREAARQIYAHLAIQEWTADSLPSLSILPSEQISLPLAVFPTSLIDGYSLTADADDNKPSSMRLLRYIFVLSQIIAQWKRDSKINASSSSEIDRSLLYEQRPSFLQIDSPLPSEENDDLMRVQHMRLIAELILQYCLFMVRRTDGNMTEQSIDAAERIMQTRSLLGSDFLAPLHKFFPIQRYTLEAAVLVVIYLHQYTAHISEERRQSLQALIDDTYAQPGFEHAHSLLSLSFDVIQPSPEEPIPINGVKRSAPDDEEGEGEEDGIVSTSGIPTEMIMSGMVLSNGNRLASSHPIVVGLRSFVNGQSLPIGSNTETLEFWDAMQRYCHLFLVG